MGCFHSSMNDTAYIACQRDTEYEKDNFVPFPYVRPFYTKRDNQGLSNFKSESKDYFASRVKSSNKEYEMLFLHTIVMLPQNVNEIRTFQNSKIRNEKKNYILSQIPQILLKTYFIE